MFKYSPKPEILRLMKNKKTLTDVFYMGNIKKYEEQVHFLNFYKNTIYFTFTKKRYIPVGSYLITSKLFVESIV